MQDEKKKEESLEWLEKAALLGSTHAAYELWKLKSSRRSKEPSFQLQNLRELRDCASSGNIDAQLTLALQYTNGNVGGISKDQVGEFITQVNMFSIKGVHLWEVSIYEVSTYRRCPFMRLGEGVECPLIEGVHLRCIPLLRLEKPVSQSCAVGKSEHSWWDTGQSNLAETDTKSFQSVVFILTQLFCGQWSSLPFCLPCSIVQ